MHRFDPWLYKFLVSIGGIALVVALLNWGVLPISRRHGPDNQWRESWAPGRQAFSPEVRNMFDVPNGNPCTHVTVAYLSIMDFLLGRAQLGVAKSMTNRPLNNGYFEIVVKEPKFVVRNPWTVPVPPPNPKRWPDNSRLINRGTPSYAF